jgi:hypothetical protein
MARSLILLLFSFVFVNRIESGEISVQTFGVNRDMTNVTLLATVGPPDRETSLYFEWGATTNYDHQTAPVTLSASSQARTNRDTVLQGVPIGDYNFRAALFDGSQTVYGTNRNFISRGEPGSAGLFDGTNFFRSLKPSSFPSATVGLWFRPSAPGVLLSELHSSENAVIDMLPGGILAVGYPNIPTLTIGGVVSNEWLQITVTYDAVNQVLNAFTNGVLAASAQGQRTNLSSFIYALGHSGATNLGGGAAFRGLMDEFTVYSRALSADEIAQNFNKMVGESDTTLRIHWKFDDRRIQPSGIIDSCSSQNDGISSTDFFGLPASTAPIFLDRRPTISRILAVNTSPVELLLNSAFDGHGLATFVSATLNDGGTSITLATLDIPALDLITNLPIVLTNLESGKGYEAFLVVSNAQGVRTGSVSFVKSGWQGNAIHFDNTDYVGTGLSIPQAGFFPNRSITVELWFDPTTPGVLAAETSYQGAYDRALIEMLPSGEVIGGFNGPEPVSLGTAQFGQWNHVALRYDSASKEMRGFLNGVGSEIHSGDRITPSDAGTVTAYAFGKSTFVAFGAGGYYGGDMDEIRVWNLPRSDQQLSADRFLLLTGDEPGLVLNWRFDHPGIDPSDLSPNNNVAGRIRNVTSTLSTAPLHFNVESPHAVEGQLTMSFLVNPVGNYLIESSSDLQTWTVVSTNAPVVGLFRSKASIDDNRPSLFYRMRQQ